MRREQELLHTINPAPEGDEKRVLPRKQATSNKTSCLYERRGRDDTQSTLIILQKSEKLFLTTIRQSFCLFVVSSLFADLICALVN